MGHRSSAARSNSRNNCLASGSQLAKAPATGTMSWRRALAPAASRMFVPSRISLETLLSAAAMKSNYLIFDAALPHLTPREKNRARLQYTTIMEN
mmetsp:Transcript_24349/g.40278  ORF Transcript_24349/g.40278 Transcript_24349/m.40278 type:complete len:95 (-) Transcript_24349:11-295(-)